MKLEFIFNARMSTHELRESLIYTLTAQVTMVVHDAHVAKGLKLEHFYCGCATTSQLLAIT